MLDLKTVFEFEMVNHMVEIDLLQILVNNYGLRRGGRHRLLRTETRFTRNQTTDESVAR